MNISWLGEEVLQLWQRRDEDGFIPWWAGAVCVCVCVCTMRLLLPQSLNLPLVDMWQARVWSALFLAEKFLMALLALVVVLIVLP